MKRAVLIVLITLGAVMVFQSVSPTNSNASNLNQINDLARTVAARERTQIFKDDAGTRRVLLGKGLNDFYGLKVSPAGTDVYDAADDDLIFNSNQNVFKIVLKDTITLTKDASDSYNAVAYDHNLGYSPACIAFIDYGSVDSPLPRSAFNQTSGILNEYVGFQDVGTVQVVFEVVAPSAGTAYALASSYDITFYLLQETAN